MIYLILSFILALLVGKLFLGFLIKKGYVQPILEDAPERHQLKSGTPTLGAITFLVPIFLGLVFLCLTDIANISYYMIYLVLILGFGFIGFKDDILKVTKKQNSEGLSPISKLILQFIISLIVCILLRNIGVDTTIGNIDIGVFYYLLVMVAIVGFSNGSNFTDGLDGLLTSVTIIILLPLLYISMGTPVFTVLCLVIGGLFAFLMYNKNPAKMFMGDTGSLVLGPIFVVSIILLDVELLGLILGAIYIFEVFSVFLQVSYFKFTKKKFGEGRRIFKMAPVHHHFEQIGYSEKKVVALFSVVAALLSVVFMILY